MPLLVALLLFHFAFDAMRRGYAGGAYPLLIAFLPLEHDGEATSPRESDRLGHRSKHTSVWTKDLYPLLDLFVYLFLALTLATPLLPFVPDI